MLTGKPNDNVIEISVFGPGRGESIAVHLGDGRWIIVDSCVGKVTKDVPVLSYLAGIGVDVSSQVHLVVATHAHDDHFAGMAKVFEACTSANFSCPIAMSSPEFFALTDIVEQDHVGLPIRAYREYRRVFELIESREKHGFEPVKYAVQQRHLFTETGTSVHRDVIALSPSDKSFRRAMRAIRKVMPTVDVPGYVPPIDPNELAIALRIEAGDKRLLLGADMLKGPRGSGWHAVLAEPRPDRKASVFKVSHHGSSTGHRAGVWSELLLKDPLALLTPFRGAPVPSEADRRRILKLTTEAYITAPPKKPSMTDAVKKEITALGSLAKNVREADDKVGQIRARSGIGEDKWEVELEAPAEHL